ncbi:MAG: T9SS type A sorting domain-containing protein [Saprospiraceae bacterium]|nr:T9SS type A sorting domain-containing protein [Saprospiraceae bacterium]
MITSIQLIAQGKRDYIWHLGGTNSTSADSTYWRYNIDFNQIPKEIYITHKDFRIHQNNASICDTAGNLLMYTAGCWVSDRNFQRMPNGTINQGEGHDLSCSNGDYRISFGTLILNQTNQKNYIVLHKFKEFVQDSLSIIAVTKLLYSIADMSLNNGFGDLTQKNQLAIDRYLSASDLTAVRHANGRDWWVVCPGRANNSYFTVLFTENGPLPYREQKIGTDFYFLDDGGSQSCFSPDGNLYARMTPSRGLFLLDFDRNTGVFSNFRQLITGSETTDHTVGVAFSPDSRFVYLVYRWDLYQADTRSPDLSSSLVHIDHWDGYVEDGIWVAGFDAAMSGPDCKIYIRTGTSNRVMHVIHQPNQKGKNCQFEQHGLFLPARNHASIPNFVNYRLGHEAFCDSTLVVNNWHSFQENYSDLLLYPNPAGLSCTMEDQNQDNCIQNIQVFDLQGKKIDEFIPISQTYKHKFSTQQFKSGVYVLKVKLSNQKYHFAKLMIH